MNRVHQSKVIGGDVTDRGNSVFPAASSRRCHGFLTDRLPHRFFSGEVEAKDDYSFMCAFGKNVILFNSILL